MVTEQQISFWKTFGYLVFRNVFPKDESDQIRHDFDVVMAKEQEGKLFTGEESNLCTFTAIFDLAKNRWTPRNKALLKLFQHLEQLL